MDAEFAEMLARCERMRADAAAHAAVCKEPICERCERYGCPKCKARVDGRDTLCGSCKRERDRVRWARAALAATPKAFQAASLEAEWLVRLVGAQVIGDAKTALGAPRVVAVGPSGSGKTSLVTAMFIAADFVPDINAAPMHVSAYQLARARAVHPLGSGEAPLVEAALGAPLLVLDELGGEDAAHASAVKDVLHERHAQERPTWVTTGVTPAEIGARYGGGIARRVFEDAKVFRLAGRTR